MTEFPKYFHFSVLSDGTKVELRDVSDHDFVEVVRCKDCKHNRGEVTDMWGNPAVQCDYEIDYKPLDWYCAAGEKE